MRTDLTLATYRMVESGRVDRLRSIDAQALADVFGVRVEEVRAAHDYDVKCWRQHSASSSG